MKQKQKSKKFWAIIACASAYTMWGFNTPLVEKSLTSFPIFSLIFAKFFVSAVVFMVLARKHWKKVSPKLWTRITVATFFGYLVNAAFFYQSVKMTGGLNASLIYLLAPLVLYFCSIRFLRERYDHKLMFSVIAGFIGTILIVSAPLLTGHAGSAGSLLGNILGVLAVITDVTGTILIKPVLRKVPTMQIAAIRSVLGSIMMIPLVVSELPKLADIQVTTMSGFALAYNLIFASTIAVYLYHKGLARIGGEQVSPLQYLDPTIGAVASMLILSQRPAPSTLIGITLVFAGLYIGGAHKLRLGHHHATSHR